MYRQSGTSTIRAIRDPYREPPATFVLRDLGPRLRSRLSVAIDAGRPLGTDRIRRARGYGLTIAAAITALLAYVALCLHHFGQIGRAYFILPNWTVVAFSLLAFAPIAALIVRWSERRERGLLPRSGTFLLFTDVVQLDGDTIHVTPLTFVKDVVLNHVDGKSFLAVELLDGANEIWPGREGDAEEILADRSRLALLWKAAEAAGADFSRFARVDPLFDLRTSCDRTALRAFASRPLVYAWVAAFIASISIGLSVRDTRDELSDRSALDQALAQRTSMALHDYLLAGGRSVNEVQTHHLPDALKREALAIDNSRGLRDFLSHEPRVPRRETSGALAQLERNELERAKGRSAAAVWLYLQENPDATNRAEARAAYVDALALELSEGRAVAFWKPFGFVLASVIRDKRPLRISASYNERVIVQAVQELLDERLLVPGLVTVTGTLEHQTPDVEVSCASESRDATIYLPMGGNNSPAMTEVFLRFKHCGDRTPERAALDATDVPYAIVAGYDPIAQIEAFR